MPGRKLSIVSELQGQPPSKRHQVMSKEELNQVILSMGNKTFRNNTDMPDGKLRIITQVLMNQGPPKRIKTPIIDDFLVVSTFKIQSLTILLIQWVIHLKNPNDSVGEQKFRYRNRLHSTVGEFEVLRKDSTATEVVFYQTKLMIDYPSSLS